MVKHKHTLIIVAIILVFILAIASFVGIMWHFKNAGSTNVSAITGIIDNQIHLPTPEEIYIQQEQESVAEYYRMHTLQEIKDMVTGYEGAEWQLVYEEEVPIEYEVPEYDPEDTRPYQMQVYVSELGKQHQVLKKLVTDFLHNERSWEDFEYNSQWESNTYGYNFTSYLAYESPDKISDTVTHYVRWRFLVGTADSTTSGMYTYMIFRCDVYQESTP